jgi:hypothetical protein
MSLFGGRAKCHASDAARQPPQSFGHRHDGTPGRPGHERDHSLEIIRFDPLLDSDALTAEEAVHLPSAEGRAIIADERLAADDLPPVVRFFRRQHEHRVILGQQRDPYEMRRQIERRPDGDGEVQLSGIHTVHELQGDARH